MPGMTNNEQQCLWLGALRYYMGRETYAVSEFCELLIKSWPDINDVTQLIIKRDLEREIERRKERAGWTLSADMPLGMDMDYQEWLKVQELWK